MSDYSRSLAIWATKHSCLTAITRAGTYFWMMLLLLIETMAFVSHAILMGDLLMCCGYREQSADPILTLLGKDLHLIFVVPCSCYTCCAEELGIVGIDGKSQSR